MPSERSYTMSYDVDDTIMSDLESELVVLRRSIARLSADACGTVLDTFGHLGPNDLVVIDLGEDKGTGEIEIDFDFDFDFDLADATPMQPSKVSAS